MPATAPSRRSAAPRARLPGPSPRLSRPGGPDSRSASTGEAGGSPPINTTEAAPPRRSRNAAASAPASWAWRMSAEPLACTAPVSGRSRQAGRRKVIPEPGRAAGRVAIASITMSVRPLSSRRATLTEPVASSRTARTRRACGGIAQPPRPAERKGHEGRIALAIRQPEHRLERAVQRRGKAWILDQSAARPDRPPPWPSSRPEASKRPHGGAIADAPPVELLVDRRQRTAPRRLARLERRGERAPRPALPRPSRARPRHRPREPRSRHVPRSSAASSLAVTPSSGTTIGASQTTSASSGARMSAARAAACAISSWTTPGTSARPPTWWSRIIGSSAVKRRTKTAPSSDGSTLSMKGCSRAVCGGVSQRRREPIAPTEKRMGRQRHATASSQDAGPVDPGAFDPGFHQRRQIVSADLPIERIRRLLWHTTVGDAIRACPRQCPRGAAPPPPCSTQQKPSAPRAAPCPSPA